MDAIILAGGFGTRLKEVINDIPKPMSPVAGKPFLSYLIDQLSMYDIDRIILSVGYLSDKIISFYGDKYKNIELIYCVEDTPLGTGGAIKKTMEMAESSNVLILNGDSIMLSDLNELIKEHVKNKATITLALKSAENFDRYGAVKHSEGIITDFCEKKYTEKGEFNAGIYVADREKLLDFMSDMNGRFSFEESVLNSDKLAKNCKCFDDYFIDIGIPEDYTRSQIELKKQIEAK